MKLSDLAISMIIETIYERWKEAEDEYKQNYSNEFNAGYAQAYCEVVEIIENRKDL